VLRDFPGNLKIALSDAPSFHYAITQQIRPFGYAAYSGRRRVPLRPEARRGDEIEYCLGLAVDVAALTTEASVFLAEPAGILWSDRLLLQAVEIINSAIAKTVVVRILIYKIPRVSFRRIVVKAVGGVLEVD
jgi:hypothetical protein